MSASLAITLCSSASAAAEFAEAYAWFEKNRIDCVSDVASALERVRETSPRTIFLLASHRGAFAQSDVEALHRQSPLSHLIHVCGAWCEGETRSGRSLAGVTRVYAHQFIGRAQGDYAGWRLPRTATAIDAILQMPRPPRLVAAPLIEIVTSSHADFLALADAATALGSGVFGGRDLSISRDSFRQRLPTPSSSIAATLWDGRSLPVLQQFMGEKLDRARGPIIAFLDFPRVHEIAAAKAFGVAAVISKPFLLGDLRQTLVALGVLPATSPAARQAG